jgi:cysteinyl-tRNA synthetase
MKRYFKKNGEIMLTLHNSLTQKRDVFTPIDTNNVRLYCCGPTVYDYAHIGNGRAFVATDLLYRLLRQLFPHVTYVRNITDIDDKIMAAAAQNGESMSSLTTRTAAAFQADMAALLVLPPDKEPLATQHIDTMIAMIETLLARGHAYVAEGHVLFHVPSMPDYGCLSGRNRQEQLDGARIEVAPYKRDGADFILWKPSSAQQPGWQSPWGRGRPGWHIECSAMSAVHLGAEFDIHAGGLDLIFPHHENEIAQSACVHSGRPHARYWVHNGFLMVEGQKMSKSLGNFLTVHQLLEEGIAGETIRLTLLMAHYRQPLDFTRAGLTQAKTMLDRWYGALLAPGKDTAPTISAPQQLPPPQQTPPSPGLSAGRAQPAAAVLNALCDDLNTPLAISHLHELVSAIYKAEGTDRLALQQELRASAALMGLLQSDAQAWFKAGAGLSDAQITAMIAARQQARATRNFAEADRLRAVLAAAGIVLEDRAHTTDWRRA